MKPKRLEFCGINSFSEKAVIDFDKLLSGGIFGIFGDTGSGKTTILDSMIFALYGRVDRTRGNNAGEIINYRCEKAYVIFDFECEWNGKRRLFRVDREIKRKNSQQNLELCEIEGETVRSVSDGVKKTNEKILEIVGLSFEDFKKCIALPQGEFAQFVKADRGERLKLISRLFDLECYGDRLNAVLKGRYDAVKSEFDKKEGELSGYASYTEEEFARLSAELSALKKKKEELDAEYAARRDSFEKIKSAFERSQKAAALRAALAEAEKKKGEIESERAVLKALPFAAEAAKTHGKIAASEKECGELSESIQRAEKEHACAAAEREGVLRRYEQADYDNTIAEIKARRAQLKTVDLDVRQLSQSVREREQLAQKYKETAKEKGDISQKLALVEKKIAEQVSADRSDDSTAIEEFLRENFESALLADEHLASMRYFTEKLALLQSGFAHEGDLYFAAEHELTERVEYYRSLCSGEKNSDAFGLLEKFKNVRAEQDKRIEIRHKAELEREKLLSMLRRADETLARTAEQGARLKETISGLSEKIRAAVGEEAAEDVAKAEKLLASREAALVTARDSERAALEKLQKRISDAEIAKARDETRIGFLQSSIKELSDALQSALRFGGFLSVGEAETLATKYPDADALSEKIKSYDERVRGIRELLRELEESSGGSEITRDEFESAVKEFDALTEQKDRTGKECAVFQSGVERFREMSEKKTTLEKERTEICKRLDLTEKLRKLFYGNAFMEFVAGEYLSDISAAATETLLKLTSGRYFIRYEQGFFVGDNFNGGELRSVNTLSGGETFLVSLSLALALSAAIYARSLRPIEFFFLDEGFGTLDEKLIDTVMDSLEKLKNTHFSIGLISHVEELKHRIDHKITVISATESGGSSKIKITC